MVIRHRTIAAVLTAAVATIFLSSAESPAHAQESSAEARFSQTLQGIENAKLALVQKEAYVERQSQQIESLRTQINSVSGVAATIEPMLAKMVASIESEIKADIPFRIGERLARLDKLRADVEDPAVRVGEKMRSALRIYDIEVGYGNSLEAYKGNHPVAERSASRYAACEADQSSAACGLTEDMQEALASGASLRDLRDDILDGDYLRYGRLALSYLNHDGSEGYRYDVPSKEWVELNAGQIIELRRGLRTARGEAAPAVVNAPVYITN